ncbi:MAG: DUF3857 domain-containing protein [Candidatus Eisenbacteria bacterium]|nr:DUF3857 domain-containing protein [Candidatus Eisenbacteria bacterium]
MSFRYLLLPLVAALALLAATAVAQTGEQQSDLPPGDVPPPTLVDRVESAGTAEDHDGADYVVVFEHAVNRVSDLGVSTVNETVVYKALTAAGCRNLAVRTWWYEPWSRMMRIEAAAVIRDGELIPFDVDALDLPAPQSSIYWNARIRMLQTPRLNVGDGLMLKLFRKGYSYALLEENGAAATSVSTAATDSEEDGKYVPPMPGEYFDIVLFQESVPVIERRYELVLPADKRIHSETYNGPLYSSTTYSGDSTRYAWWAKDVPARPSEYRSAAASDISPKVVLATVESWEAKSRWFFDVNRNQFDVTPEIQAKIDEILEVAGVARGTEEQKAEVLVHWVAQNIRYSGQTMGEGEGFMLHPGWMIFEQRSGVCKDIAGMLITMMRAAGMDSYGAMTMAGSRIEEVPADQFNHCVTALRTDDGSFVMYDPTWVPYVNDIWSKYETEQQYLIGTAEGEYLATIPYSPPEESPLRVDHEATLSVDGTLEGTLRLETAGALDGRLRNLVGWRRRADLHRDIAGLLSHIGPAVESFEFDHPERDDFSQNMWLEIEYRLRDAALPVGQGLEFRSPATAVVLNDGWLFRAGVRDWPEDRETDLFLWFTQLVDIRERITVPRGYDLVESPEADEVDATYAAFAASFELDGRTLAIDSEAEVRRRQIPPEGYAGFREAITAMRTWGDGIYRVEEAD